MPGRILVEDSGLHDLLEPMMNALRITVNKERALSAVADIRESLMERFAHY